MLENIDLSSSTDKMKVAKKPEEVKTARSVSEGSKAAAPMPEQAAVATPDAVASPLVKVMPRKEVVQKPGKRGTALIRSQSALSEARMLRMRCKQLCISLFLDKQRTTRSLGFTSAIDGEGKSFIAMLAADVMSEDSGIPTTLLECNWEHPSFGDSFRLPPGPGLAEWLRGECKLGDIRQRVSYDLTVITAGDDRGNPVRLLQQLRQKGMRDILIRPDEVLVADLPSTLATAYGQLAASLLDEVIVVVRAGVTPEAVVAEACNQLKDANVHGLILNQIESRIPRWLRQLL